MKKAQLSGSLRANVGKKDAASLRSENRVPCVLYGQGEQTHFSVKRVELNKIVFSPEVYQVELEIEGKKAVGIVREIQQHPVKDTIQHIDFYELSESKKVRVDLPVRTKGSAKGVLNGGKLNMAFRTLSCYGLPGDLPDAIVLDISPIRIGQSIRISEVSIPGVTILDPANAVVLGVKISRGAVDEEEEEEEETEGTEGAEGAEGASEENKEKTEG
ncbi:MAG: 50S ribosomal protein L25 [Crocinitomicaceae bacterium]|nr:50S ribosomal protein L25 [Crocinitomicaceae bacterium]MDG1736252.1 50S ribosomal protein L25 [Crocinitomicaceae bacterium]